MLIHYPLQDFLELWSSCKCVEAVLNTSATGDFLLILRLSDDDFCHQVLVSPKWVYIIETYQVPCGYRSFQSILIFHYTLSQLQPIKIVTESAYCSRYCAYLMLDVSYLGSTIVVLLSLLCTFLICYSFLLGYLSLSSLIASFAILVPFRQPYAFLLVLLV